MVKARLLTVILLLTLCTLISTLSAQAVFAAVANADKVKVLAEPADSAPVIATLRLGDIVKVYTKSADNQYWEIEHKGIHGWVATSHLSPKDYRYSTSW